MTRPQTNGFVTHGCDDRQISESRAEPVSKHGVAEHSVMTGNATAPVHVGALIGYARVSTSDQDPALQLDALATAGCARVFVEEASGAKADRPELARAVDYARPGDVLTVWRLDRLGRSLPHLVETVGTLEARGVGFKSLTEAIDTTSPTGRLLFHLMAAIGQFERDLIRERTHAGLAAARARGRIGGRPRAMSSQQSNVARQLHAAGELSVTEIAKMLDVSRATIYRSLAADG